MNARKAHCFLLSTVFLGLLGVSATQAAKSSDYQPELDTKQTQPHTADEISNEPKAEGAKGQPDSNQNGTSKNTQHTTEVSKANGNKTAKGANDSATTNGRTQSDSDSAKTDSRAPATDASTDATNQRNQDTTDSSKIDTSSSVKEGNQSTTTDRSQSNSDAPKNDGKVTDSNETGTVHHNQSSAEFKRDKAKCEELVGQSQDQCLLDLQKKYTMPTPKQ